MTPFRMSWTVTPDAVSTARFCQRWVEKAARYDDSSLDGAFDKFFSLFVAFNRLYSHLTKHLGRIGKDDKRRATEWFSCVVGPDALMTALNANSGSDDLRTLADLIAPGGMFYLISEKTADRPDLRLNQALHDQLHSTNNSTKIHALLQYLYFVRCNMFHGSKGFDNEQLRIIQPAARCLERVVREGLRKIHENAA